MVWERVESHWKESRNDYIVTNSCLTWWTPKCFISSQPILMILETNLNLRRSKRWLDKIDYIQITTTTHTNTALPSYYKGTVHTHSSQHHVCHIQMSKWRKRDWILASQEKLTKLNSLESKVLWFQTLG